MSQVRHLAGAGGVEVDIRSLPGVYLSVDHARGPMIPSDPIVKFNSEFRFMLDPWIIFGKDLGSIESVMKTMIVDL